MKNLYDIIVDILGLLFAFLSLLAALKGNSTPPQNTSPANGSYTNDSYGPGYDVQSRNQKTLEKWLSWGISITLPFILIFTIWYNWNNIPSSGTSSIPVLNFLNNILYLGVGYTTKITVFTIPILSIGIVIKNIKNQVSQFRIFNILTYSLLTIASIWLIFLVFRLDYLSFIPTNSSLDVTVSNDIFFNLIYDFAFVISLLQVMLIYFIILSASNELIFGRQYSNDLEKNAKYICSKILLILLFAFLIWYWTYVWK